MKIEYFYDEEKNHRNLAYVFTPSENRMLEGNNFGGEVFFRNGYDTVAFKISNDDWFQSVPPGVFAAIHGIIAERGYDKEVAYGSSMGGYASIALSKLLDCSAVIAFSPQYSIDDDFDKRWAFFSNKINFQYRISKESTKMDCGFFIFYDNKDPDELQVKRLLEVLPPESTKVIKLPFSGHPSVHFLNEVGLLKDILTQLANVGHVDGIDFYKKKKNSSTYLLALSRELLKKKHARWALSVADFAVIINQNSTLIHFQRSAALEHFDRMDEAVAAVKRAMELAPENPHLKHRAGLLLRKLGAIEEAIAIIQEALVLAPKSFPNQNLLRDLLDKRNAIAARCTPSQQQTQAE